MSEQESPKDDIGGRRARLRQRLGEIAPAAVHEYRTLDAQAFAVTTPDVEAAPLGPPPAADDPGWRELAPGEPWGEPKPLLTWGFPADGGAVTWLRADVEVPAEWAGDDVLLHLDDPHGGIDGVGLEALVHLDGAVFAGMDDWHRGVLLPDPAPDHAPDHAPAPGPAPENQGRRHTVLLRCTTANRRPFGGLQLRRRHRDTWQLGVLARTLLGVADALPAGDVTATALLAALDDAYRTLDLRSGWNSEALRASASRALPALRAALPHGVDQRPTVVASGHAHLDVAWLWPVWRTRQKVAHTVASALHLMDRYPDYHFSLSAPQTWQFLREDTPGLFERVLARAAEGRLEPVGVFWLESDGNLPSGESFVRQVRHGTRFYRELLGTVPNAAWLPDSFGFSAVIPTVLSGFGVRALMTTKLSWNRVNRMPADTFRWRGPDGSEVLAHFVTTSSTPVKHPTDPSWHTYAGDLSAAEVAGVWAHYRGKDVSPEVLYLYGHGDGGGGPTEEMVASAAAMADVPGFPRVRPGRAAEFFDRLLERARDHPLLPTWDGDLYFEMHRGTYTSQARTKRGNRDGELALREAEWANAWAVLAPGATAADRQGELDDAWTAMLRNQFHDILPGSSIPRVYVDAAAEHAAVLAAAARIRDAALGAVLDAGGPDGSDRRVVLNSLPWNRSGVVESADGGQAPELVWGSAPSYGWRRLDAADPPPRAATVRAAGRAEGDGWVLENGVVRAVLDARGELASLVELASGLELVAAGQSANRLVLFEDRPLFWDAWDVDAFYADKPTPLDTLDAVELVHAGPFGSGLRAGVRLTRRSGASTVVQTLSLDAGGRRLDVVTEVDWQERNVLLRALFPFSPNARHVTLGRQFGSVEQVVHRNTSWEQARFEFAAHGWLDVSDGTGGVALLTDAIYGHSVEQSTVGLSLLKSGSWPDPQADRGAHRLRYALLPHAGSWQDAAVPRAALDLAVPLRAVGSRSAGGGPGSSAAGTTGASLLTVDGDHVIAETVKTAWDGDGIVVRLHEAHNRRGPVTLVLDRPVLSAELTDLDERPRAGGRVEVDGARVRLEVSPHQLVTLRLRLR